MGIGGADVSIASHLAETAVQRKVDDLMKVYLKILLLIAIVSLLLPACSGDTSPQLARPGAPTLVYIYADG